jgi:hypothetical protein
MRYGCLAAGLAGLFAVAAQAGAQELRPFAEVPNVCPACDSERYDTITLKNGQVVRAWVLTENSMFYVLEKLGQQRAVGKSEVSNIELSRLRSDAERKALRDAYPDQVLLRDGHVVAGVIQDVKDSTGLYKIEIPDTKSLHLLYKAQISHVFRGGKEIYKNSGGPAGPASRARS